MKHKGASAMLYFVTEDREASSGVPLIAESSSLISESSSPLAQSFNTPSASLRAPVESPAIKHLLKEYNDVLREELPDGLPPVRSIEHAIDTGDKRPYNRNAFPLSEQQLREQTKQVEDLLKKGLIRESSSPWGAPVLFVAKKTPGEWRMCIDY